MQREQLAASEEIRRLEERRETAGEVEAAQRQALERLRGEYRDAEQAKRARDSEAIELRQKLNSKEFTADEAIAELERLRAEEAARRAEIERRIAEKRAELPVYEQEEGALRAELGRLEVGVAELRDKTTAARDEVDRWKVTDELLRAEQARRPPPPPPPPSPPPPPPPPSPSPPPPCSPSSSRPPPRACRARGSTPPPALTRRAGAQEEVHQQLQELQHNQDSWPDREAAMRAETDALTAALADLESREAAARTGAAALSGRLIEAAHEAEVAERELARLREEEQAADSNIERLVQVKRLSVRLPHAPHEDVSAPHEDVSAPHTHSGSVPSLGQEPAPSRAPGRGLTRGAARRVDAGRRRAAAL